jgi:5'-methylthioadenosine phosphorylase
VSGARAEIGIIGGTGFYRFLDEVTQVPLHTPYGAPSSPIAIGQVEGRSVAFLARHGVDHQLPPHLVNYRANLWALRELGVRQVVAPSAAGSLRREIAPGDLVVCDQLVDRTWGRADTFVEGPVIGHAPFADPYCPQLGDALASAATPLELRVHRRGTVVVIQGPRFSTRAESAWFRSAGWDLVSMTQYPEAALARELGMCFAGVGLVTDYDTGPEDGGGHAEGGEAVTIGAVLAVLGSVVERARALLVAAIPRFPPETSCACGSAVEHGPFGAARGV